MSIGVSSVVTWFTWLYVPVSTAARDGVQIEFVQKQLSNRIPPEAMRSMFGVWLIRLPYAEMAWAAWSSDIMKMRLGCRVTSRGYRLAGSRKATTCRTVHVLDTLKN